MEGRTRVCHERLGSSHALARLSSLAAKDGLFAPREYNRSFSHDVTTALFVYKTMDQRSCLSTKKIPVGIELFSHVKPFFYSKQFAKLLTT